MLGIGALFLLFVLLYSQRVASQSCETLGELLHHPSETGESTKCPWVEAVGLIALWWRGTRETLTASLRLMLAKLVAPATATAVSHFLEGKDVLAVLGLSLIHQSFVLAKEMDESSVDCSSGRP